MHVRACSLCCRCHLPPVQVLALQLSDVMLMCVNASETVVSVVSADPAQVLALPLSGVMSWLVDPSLSKSPGALFGVMWGCVCVCVCVCVWWWGPCHDALRCVFGLTFAQRYIHMCVRGVGEGGSMQA
jgi:hypothetical protein